MPAPQSLRNLAYTAHFHRVVREIVEFHSTIGSRRHREILPSHSIGERQLARDLPLVANIRAIQTRSCSEHIRNLIDASQRIRDAQQERRERVVLTRGRAVPQRGLPGCKRKTSGRPEERSKELRLCLVQILAVKVGSEPDVVAALRPIGIRHVLKLRIVQNIRLKCVRRSENREIGDIELRPSAFEPARAIGARQSKKILADLFIQPRLAAVGLHARVAEVGIDKESRLCDVRSGDR